MTLANAQLTELDLSDNAFGPIGVSGLGSLLSSPACYQLQVLKLNNNGLGISGGKMLAKALLKCHKNSLKDGKALSLKLIQIGRNRLENAGAVALAEVFQVRAYIWSKFITIYLNFIIVFNGEFELFYRPWVA